jgi:hypothetical protein
VVEMNRLLAGVCPLGLPARLQLAGMENLDIAVLGLQN